MFKSERSNFLKQITKQNKVYRGFHTHQNAMLFFWFALGLDVELGLLWKWKYDYELKFWMLGPSKIENDNNSE